MEEWLSASETMRLAAPILGALQARWTIARRAHNGLIRTRAERFVRGNEACDNVELPIEFWWAEGQEALEQDWIAGDFSTWIDRTEHWRAFGVTFCSADVIKILPEIDAPQSFLDKASNPPEKAQSWVSARDAVVRIMQASGQDDVRSLYSIIAYVRSGHVKARAMVIKEKIQHRHTSKEQELRDTFVPAWFWEKCTDYSSCALDWKSGVFAGHGYDAGSTLSATLTGVQFEKSGLDILDPPHQPSEQITSDVVTIPQASPKESRGGRPPAEWWDDLWVEICRQLYVGDLKPKTQSDIENAMLKWLAGKETSAAESTVRGRARKLWQAINAEDKN